MEESIELGQEINLIGKSGTHYSGRIYDDRNSTTHQLGRAIVCLTNSSFKEGKWQHAMNSIYNVRDTTEALAHFSIREDISHIILIPLDSPEPHNFDKVDDLIRSYIHG